MWSADSGTDGAAATEAACLREKLGQEECGSEEGGWKKDRWPGGGDELDGRIGKEPTEMSRAPGMDWGR